MRDSLNLTMDPTSSLVDLQHYARAPLRRRLHRPLQHARGLLGLGLSFRGNDRGDVREVCPDGVLPRHLRRLRLRVPGEQHTGEEYPIQVSRVPVGCAGFSSENAAILNTSCGVQPLFPVFNSYSSPSRRVYGTSTQVKERLNYAVEVGRSITDYYWDYFGVSRLE